MQDNEVGDQEVGDQEVQDNEVWEEVVGTRRRTPGRAPADLTLNCGCASKKDIRNSRTITFYIMSLFTLVVNYTRFC